MISRGRLLRDVLVAIVPVAVAVVAWQNRATLATAAHLLGSAVWWWLVPAAGAIAGVYLCRATVYAIPLALLGCHVRRGYLWSTALVATSLHQLIPSGGASGYAALTWALAHAGASGGAASLVGLIDTLSYAAALASLVVTSLVYLGSTGRLPVASVAGIVAPGLVVVSAVAWLYYVQRDPVRCTALVLRGSHWLTAKLRASAWTDAPVIRFLEQYYAAKAIIARRPGAFTRMLGFQYLAIGCDASAVYMACLALGVTPKVWVVLLAFVVSMAGLAIVTVPGGGGSFEVIMSVFLASHGLARGQGVAVAVLYRVVAFWLPVTVTLVILLRVGRLRRRARD